MSFNGIETSVFASLKLADAFITFGNQTYRLGLQCQDCTKIYTDHAAI